MNAQAQKKRNVLNSCYMMPPLRSNNPINSAKLQFRTARVTLPESMGGRLAGSTTKGNPVTNCGCHPFVDHLAHCSSKRHHVLFSGGLQNQIAERERDSSTRPSRVIKATSPIENCWRTQKRGGQGQNRDSKQPSCGTGTRRKT